MSHSKFSIAQAIGLTAKNTHYAVSTFAAVLYALIWLLANGAHAEGTQSAPIATLPAIVVTAYRPAVLSELVVVGYREGTIATLDPVVVMAQREPEQRVAATVRSKDKSGSRGGYFARVRNWFGGALLK